MEKLRTALVLHLEVHVGLLPRVGASPFDQYGSAHMGETEHHSRKSYLPVHSVIGLKGPASSFEAARRSARCGSDV